MYPWKFYLPTRVIFGVGCLKQIRDSIQLFRSGRVLLVTGRRSMKKYGITDRIIEYLDGYDVVVYDKVEPNPTVKRIEDGIRFLKDEGCDLVVGLGGGSVIDVAKAVSVLSRNPVSVEGCLYKKEEIITKGLQLIAIPTTAGTGTEVTQYASVIDEKRKRKLSLSHEYFRPDVAIVDPALTVTLPPFITAVTGLDSLSQCIEAYWSKNHTPISDIFALDGIKLIFGNLVNVFNSPDDIGSREKMALASLFSGIVISIAKTTIVHSVSYPITVHFKVPHGLACSLTLPSFLRYNSRVVEDRILDIGRMMGVRTVEECARKIEKLISDVKLPRRLKDVGIKREDIKLIVEEGFRPDRAENNPSKVTQEDLRKILEDLL